MTIREQLFRALVMDGWCPMCLANLFDMDGKIVCRICELQFLIQDE